MAGAGVKREVGVTANTAHTHHQPFSISISTTSTDTETECTANTADVFAIGITLPGRSKKIVTAIRLCRLQPRTALASSTASHVVITVHQLTYG